MGDVTPLRKPTPAPITPGPLGCEWQAGKRQSRPAIRAVDDLGIAEVTLVLTDCAPRVTRSPEALALVLAQVIQNAMSEDEFGLMLAAAEAELAP